LAERWKCQRAPKRDGRTRVWRRTLIIKDVGDVGRRGLQAKRRGNAQGKKKSKNRLGGTSSQKRK